MSGEPLDAAGEPAPKASALISEPRGALLSPDRLYRYRLWRSWPPGGARCVFIGLNPSTADETEDDPTIRKCVGFTRVWTQWSGPPPHFGAIDMVNLFAFRSTSPAGLLTAADPVGPDTDEILRAAIAGASRIVLCWGQHSPAVRRLVETRLRSVAWHELRRTLRYATEQRGADIGTFGPRLSDGSPRHPLMLAYRTPFVREAP